MALNHSPRIVTDGLVFYYDMNNTEKSWKGKPTTNYVITTVENYTGWGGAGWWIHPGNTVTTNYAPLPTGGMGTIFCATTLGTGGLYGYNGYALSTAYSSGTQYSLSFWAKNYIGAPSITVRDADSGGALSYSFSGIDATWRKFSITWYANTSSNMLTFTGSNFCLYGVQFEISSFASPFVNGTRSNTQSILDLTGRNTLTIQNLSYASIGTFSFDGVDDSIDSTTSAGLTGTGSWTMESVFKINGIPSNALYGNVIVDTDATGGSANMILVDYGGGHGGSQNQLLYASRPSTGGSYTLLGGPILTQGTYYHVAVVRNDVTNTKLYVNGSLYSTYSGNVPTATQPLVRIGRWTDGTVYGNSTIPNVKIYNRALSDQEVAQNYQALRGRYGI